MPCVIFRQELTLLHTAFSTMTLPAFTVSANTEKSFNPFGQNKFNAVDGDHTDVLEQERKALESFEVGIIITYMHTTFELKNRSHSLSYCSTNWIISFTRCIWADYFLFPNEPHTGRRLKSTVETNATNLEKEKFALQFSFANWQNMSKYGEICSSWLDLMTCEIDIKLWLKCIVRLRKIVLLFYDNQPRKNRVFTSIDTIWFYSCNTVRRR